MLRRERIGRGSRGRGHGGIEVGGWVWTRESDLVELQKALFGGSRHDGDDGAGGGSNQVEEWANGERSASWRPVLRFGGGGR